MLPGALVVGLVMALSALAGATFGPATTRRGLSLLLVLAAIATPLLAWTDEPLPGAVAGLGGVLALMRWIEASRLRVRPPVPWALLFVLPVDVPSLRRAPARLAPDVIAKAGVHGIVSAAGMTLVLVRHHAGPWAWLLAWLGGVVAVYGGVEVASSLSQAALRVMGIEVRAMQRHPVLSSSVTEFWGERWNLTVSGWIRRHVFVPVSRRAGAVVGLHAGFAWSALIHFHFVMVSVGLGAALRMGAYFIVQGALVWLETRLAIRGWPRPLARAWTVLGVVGPSWLFIEPVLAIFGVR